MSALQLSSSSPKKKHLKGIIASGSIHTLIRGSSAVWQRKVPQLPDEITTPQINSQRYITLISPEESRNIYNYLSLLLLLDS